MTRRNQETAQRAIWAAAALFGALVALDSAADEQRIWSPYLHGVQPALPEEEFRFEAAADEEAAARSQINLRRSQIGLHTFTHNLTIDQAALGHANYLALNNLTGHFQDQSLYPNGSTGVDLGARLTAAGYAPFYNAGEVIAFGPASGVVAVENLLEAIYHRFGIFATALDEQGTG